MTSEAELRAKYEALCTERNTINQKMHDVWCEIQRVCQHEWKLHQVAGEGRFCIKCGKWDESFDD